MVEMTDNLQRLKEDYIKRLPEKIAHLNGLMRQLAHPDTSGEVLNAIALAVYWMHGWRAPTDLSKRDAWRGMGEGPGAPSKNGPAPGGGGSRPSDGVPATCNCRFLPRSPPPKQDRVTVAVPSETFPDAAGPRRARRPRVLLVEDDLDLSVWIEEILREKGMDCVKAGEVGEGLIQLLEKDADLILSDYRLPDGKGKDLIHQVRQRDTMVPILLMSGAISKELGEMFREAVDEFMEKSLAREPFLAAVERHSPGGRAQGGQGAGGRASGDFLAHQCGYGRRGIAPDDGQDRRRHYLLSNHDLFPHRARSEVHGTGRLRRSLQ